MVRQRRFARTSATTWCRRCDSSSRSTRQPRSCGLPVGGCGNRRTKHARIAQCADADRVAQERITPDAGRSGVPAGHIAIHARAWPNSPDGSAARPNGAAADSTARRVRASGPVAKCLGIRPALRPALRRCSSLTYARYARSSRLASRAHRRPRCTRHFTTGPLAGRWGGHEEEFADQRTYRLRRFSAVDGLT